MLNWGRAADLVAETVREIGVLLLVFAPLDATFAEVPPGALFLIGILLLAVALIVGGIIMEARK